MEEVLVKLGDGATLNGTVGLTFLLPEGRLQRDQKRAIQGGRFPEYVILSASGDPHTQPR